MTIPVWVFSLVVTLAVSGIGAAITIAMNWARVSVRLSTLQKSADALHERVDELGTITAKLSEDVRVLKKLDEREFLTRAGTSPHGIPIRGEPESQPPPTRPRRHRPPDEDR